MDLPSISGSGKYQLLQKYLSNRFADTVVLTLSQIEDLLGFPLPDAASRDLEWWASIGSDGTSSEQSKSWVQAKRSAVPRLNARVVMFERLPA